jgi:hypothetical protein
MDTKDLSPGLVAAVVVLVIAIVGFLIYRGTSVKTYTGPPIDMGATMRQSRPTAPPGPNGAPLGGAPAVPAPGGR